MSAEPDQTTVRPQPAGARGPVRARGSAVVGGVLTVLMAAELLFLYSGASGARLAAHAAAAVFLFAGLPFFRLREFYLIAVAAGLVGVALWTGAGSVAVLLRGLDQMAFLIAFILLLKLLETGATTSAAILTCGEYLTRQPAVRRYAGLTLGSHLLGVVVNLGTVSLLAPLVQRGARAGLAPGEPLSDIAAVRERRQLCALLRGFSWMVIWSPTAVAPAVLLTLLPGIDGPRLVGLGMATALVLLSIGWAEDWLRWRSFHRRLVAEHRLPERRPMPFPLVPFVQLLAVCGVLAALTLLFSIAGGVRIVPGLMLAAAVVGIGWIAAQNRHAETGVAVATRARLAAFGTQVLPSTAPIAMTLGCSGFIGAIAAALVPIEALSHLLQPQVVPGWVFLAALPLLLAVTGHLAVSPIMMAVFFGSVLGALPQLPAEPTLVALALACGWALSMNAAPFSAVVLLTAQVTGIRATTLTWRWNLPYALAAALTLTAVFYLLTGGT